MEIQKDLKKKKKLKITILWRVFPIKIQFIRHF